jgi:hypothetical protein
MKKSIVTIVFVFVGVMLFSQDVDFYLKRKNDNFDMPKIPSHMSFDEFNLLSQNYRMQDMMFALVVPGYIHFKAQENKTAYIELAISGISYSAIAYEYLWLKKNVSDSSNLMSYLRDYKKLDATAKSHTDVITAAIVLISANYLFDIIHGKYILEKKQNKIRFKYSIRADVSSYSYGGSEDLAFGLKLSLRF